MAAHSFEWFPLRNHASSAGPCARWGQTATCVDNGVVLIGGTDTFEGALSDVFRYSEEAGWSAVATTNCPRLAAHTANLIGRHIYCFGGDGQSDGEGIWAFSNTDEMESVKTWALNVDTLAWSVPACRGRPPQWRRTGASATAGSLAYLIGGWGIGGPLNDVHILDVGMLTCSWRQVQFGAHEPSLPQRGSHSATIMGPVGRRCIMVYGGFNGKQLGDLWVLDIDHGHPSWHRPQTSGTAPEGGRSGHSATAFGSHLVLLGGERELQRTFFHDIYVLNSDDMVWSVAQVSGSGPQARGWHSSTLLPDSRILVFGGGRYTEFFGDGFVLDLASGGSVPEPPDDLAIDFGRLMAREDLADICFALEGGAVSVYAHRVVLCARSALFDSMLTEKSRWAEGSQPEIPVEGVPAASFRVFLQYLYTGTCNFGRSSGTSGSSSSGTATLPSDSPTAAVAGDVKCAMDLLSLSALHMLPRLQAQCVTVLGRALKQRTGGLEPGSPVFEELLQLSTLHEVPSLRQLAQRSLQQQEQRQQPGRSSVIPAVATG